MKRSALVIGGGIAGPTLAVFLARAGVTPIVMEAYPRAGDVGGGLQIAPNGMRVLSALGVADRLLAAGHPCADFAFKNHRGRTIGVAKTRASGIGVNVMRAALHRVLRDEAEREGVTIFYEKRLSDIALAGKEVVATFEDGSTEVADMLIGADGVHSRVRAWMIPEHARPRDTGMVSIGGFCASNVTEPTDAEDAARLTFMVGPKHQFGYSLMDRGENGGRRWGWWCHAAFRDDEERRALCEMPADELRALMRERYAGWARPTQDFIESTATWSRTHIHDVPSLPAWHRGRVVLMGDAAHAMSPAGGQGASLALEDAMLLGRLLGDTSFGVEDAMARFESLRRSRAEAMVAQGYANDQRSLRELGAFGVWMRDNMMLPLIAPMLARALNKVYTERVTELQ